MTDFFRVSDQICQRTNVRCPAILALSGLARFFLELCQYFRRKVVDRFTGWQLHAGGNSGLSPFFRFILRRIGRDAGCWLNEFGGHVHRHTAGANGAG